MTLKTMMMLAGLFGCAGTAPSTRPGDLAEQTDEWLYPDEEAAPFGPVRSPGPSTPGIPAPGS